MELTKVNRDFLLTAPREETLSMDYVEMENGNPYFFKAVSILGGRFAILEVESGKKGAARPDWSAVEIIEPRTERDDFVLGVACYQRAQEIYENRTNRVKRIATMRAEQRLTVVN